MDANDLKILTRSIENEKMIINGMHNKFNSDKYYEIFSNGNDAKNSGAYIDAIKFYQEALTYKITGEVHLRIGHCYEILEKYKEALEGYDKCIELRHKYSRRGDLILAEAYFQKGSCHLELTELNEAEISFKKSLEVLPYGDPLKNKIAEYLEIIYGRCKVILIL